MGAFRFGCGTCDFDYCDFDWGDADRVQVLYAPMRSRDLNPESHDAKVRLAKVQIFHHWYIAKT